LFSSKARHEIYTEYHHRVVEAVESCVPVTAVCSIDEMACRLIGRERPLLPPSISACGETNNRERVGDAAQLGRLATNRYLAKVASDMEKPDGLVALPLDILPEALHQLTLRDLPGIGARTEKRLNEKGLRTMDELLALDREQAGEIWGSVWGERLWHWLRGEDFEMAELEHQKSISHSHVLAPEMRTAEKAWAVAHKLLHKAAMRLRSQAGSLGQPTSAWRLDFAVPRGENTPVSRFGVPARGWRSEIKLSECQDNQTLIAALRRLWESRPPASSTSTRISSACNSTISFPDRLHTLALFDGLEEEQSRTRLLATMDQINDKYGMSTLAPAAMLTAYKAAPTRIAFNSIPDLF
jgi:DNA polymerase IV